MRRLLVLVLSTGLLTGCLERELKSLNPCLVSGVTRSINARSIDKIDLLFIVDNSNSMSEEQDALKAQFPKLITTLTSGIRANGPAFPPVKDLHLGVVSSNMGLAGIQNNYGNCDPANGGDDGLLQNVGRGPDCAASYPKFLSYAMGTTDPLQVSKDFSCIATLGTGGCGFEQQLEAGLKALWPKTFIDGNGDVIVPNPISFLATREELTFGHGDVPLSQGGNGGFLRNDVREGLSLVAIILVSDEEDCSSSNTEHFIQSMMDPTYGKQPPNQRCFFNKQNLFPTNRYVEGFKNLRPGNEQLVIFGAIVGVPEDLVSAERRATVNFLEPESRSAYYDALLGDPRMQEELNGLSGPQANLRPSCFGETADGKPAPAYPPRRIVEVAKGFGENGVVQSICAKSFEPAMDAIITAIANRIVAVCLPRPLVRQSDGLVDCNVIWELPPPEKAAAGTPIDCEGPDSYLQPVDSDRDPINDAGGKNCKVQQLPVLTTDTVPEGKGWYYDNFSAEVLQQCEGRTQRVSFTEAAKPANGVVVKLECLNKTQRLPSNDPRRDGKQPEIGSACIGVRDSRGEPIPRESACVVNLKGGQQDLSMFCHAELNVCVKSCQGDSECPAAWVCDSRPESTAKTDGRAFCVNPTCGSD